MSEVIRVLHVIGIMNRGGAEAMIMNLYRNIDRNKIQFDFVENTFEKAAFDDEIKSLAEEYIIVLIITEKIILNIKNGGIIFLKNTTVNIK